MATKATPQPAAAAEPAPVESGAGSVLRPIVVPTGTPIHAPPAPIIDPLAGPPPAECPTCVVGGSETGN